MKSKIIAGVGVNLENREHITYEQLMKSALTTKEYHNNPNAVKLIDKELTTNGFKPVKPKSKTNKSKSDRRDIQEGATEK